MAISHTGKELAAAPNVFQFRHRDFLSNTSVKTTSPAPKFFTP